MRKNQMSALSVVEKDDVEVAEKTEPPPNALDGIPWWRVVAPVGNSHQVLHQWCVDSSILHRFCRGILGDSFYLPNS